MPRIVLLFTTVLLTACMPLEPQLTFTTPNGTVAITVETAQTDEERRVGLMNRTELAKNHGMLFVFEQETPLSFWMKNTLIPLDVLYINAAGAVVDIQTMQPCATEVCTSYPSTNPAMFAVEVNAGFAELHNITVGSTTNVHDVLTKKEQ